MVQRLNDTELVESIHSRSRIVRNQEWDPALAELHPLDLAELVISLLGLDTVDGEAALGVVDETEVLASLLDADDVHEAGGVGRVSADLAVDLDETLHHDRLGLAAIESVLETVADEDDQGQTVAELVGTGRGLGSIGSGHFVQEPVRGRTEALLVLLTVESLLSVGVTRLPGPEQAANADSSTKPWLLANLKGIDETYGPRGILTALST